MNSHIKKIFFILLFCTTSAFAENNYGFVYQSEPINPACVAMFNSSLADFPYIRSININRCQHSNAAYIEKMENKNGTYSYCNKINPQDKESLEEDCYSYKVAGKSANGIYVLVTHSWSATGFGVFSDLLLLRLVKTHEYVYDGGNGHTSQPKINQITEIQLLGYVNGGDRCVGDFIDVGLVDNQLKVKQYDNDRPYDCRKTKNYSINLENLVGKND